MKDKFTVIIPTMYRSPYELNLMLRAYEYTDSIGEVILIDNDGKEGQRQEQVCRIDFSNCSKSKIIGNGNNQYVNPSWNIALEIALYENIIIANDDILIEKPDLKRLLEKVQVILKSGMLIGPNINCFEDTIISPNIVFHKGSQEITYGYGTFMIMKKESYNPVPSELKVWYGDNWQLLNKEQWYFDGVKIHTQMRTTSKTLNLKGQNTKEKAFFNAKLKELKHGKYKEA